ncbi:hypothetical protein [Parazoarcus communis]|uniref:Uncharacterized protein n=1 Tax=Parazoarcus communis SWub3 = DSM 12120 TaxID=1121029 RepID=A0A323UUD0_9RHOO|nr:hypothetical protein [Parazoarcus communis]NMG70334.1 hypothetical protein [Parazoarcus communis SWub3 = DSM 12120]PZA16105.1 hypothetical protein DNK49_13935 [Azoarcus communis] [Parazoarcus communis SWub3 = DSM 12120]
MNARENTLTPLRNLIAIHLDAAGESPADKISKAIGKADYPSVVIKELNAMRTDGLIECEQRGKKKEMAYWLSVPVSQVTGIEPPAAEAPKESTPVIVGSLPAGITEGTRAAQIWSVLPEHGEPPISAREIAARAKKVVGLIAPVLTTMHQRSQIARVSESSEGYLYTRPAPSVATEPQPAEGNITGSSASDVVTTSSEGVAVHQPAPDAAVSLSAAPVAVDDTHQLDDINVADSAYQMASAEHDDCGTTPEPGDSHATQAVKLAVKNYNGRIEEKARADELRQDVAGLMSVIYDIRCAIGDPLGKIMLGDLAQQISEALQLSEAHRQDVMAREHQIETAAEWLAEVVEGGEIEPCEMDIKELAMRASGELRNARAMIEKLEHQLASHEQAIGEIHRACDDVRAPEGIVAERVRKLAEMVCTLRMTTNALAEDPAVDLQDAATGYLIRVPKRRPRVVTKPESARAAALAAAKVAGRAEVMALVPVGRAVRGAEWRDAE